MCKGCSEESKAVLACVAYIEGTQQRLHRVLCCFLIFGLCSIENACLPCEASAFLLDISFSLCICFGSLDKKCALAVLNRAIVS